VNVRFVCPACEAPNRVERPGPAGGSCLTCGQALNLPAATDGPLAACAVCGNAELFRQKDFPQWLGLTVLAVACTTFFVLQVLYRPWLAWTVLLGSAALDGLLYYGVVGDVVVCYRCGAEHRGVPSRSFDPFELAIAERYRQERIRREQLQADKRT
jgi:hypothetical protein